MIKKHDFIEIDYTAVIKEGNIVFDTTEEKVAKKENIFGKNIKYKPAVICVGEHQVPEGLDESFIGKNNEEYQVTLHPEKAFGKKDPKLLHLMSQTSFRKQNINPYPGLQMNIDGMMGTVRTVTPGRIIVDFNHPLAGKEIIYKVKILRKVEDEKEKLDSLLEFYVKDFKSEIKNKEAIIVAKIPLELHEIIKKKILSLINSIEKITIQKE